ncbi:hypothetical protein BJX70DRAFT_405304 [Aspergillus crustosus]
MANLTKIQGFDLIQESYKYGGDHGIRADILVIADSLYMDWFPYWLSDLALEHEAIIVNANYRLLPQATGLDITSDIQDFWKWLRSPALSAILAAHSTPHRNRPRAIPPFGVHSEEALIEEYLDAAPEGPVSSTPADYLPLYARGANETHHPEVLYPLQQLEERNVKIPDGGITIIQGLNDTVVPAHHSEPFVKRLRGLTRGQRVHDKIQFITREGEHGFDGDLRYGEEEWLRKALKPVVKAWLG